MILAAPIVIPFAKALGLSIGTLGMAKATDMINNYIQENPEQSVKILSTIVPSIGIGQTVMNEEKISLEDLDEMTDEEAQDLSKEEKAELMKQARSGSEQSKSIGQGNVGSKASFGGGKGTDRSGRSEGISGVDRSKVTQEQNINQLKNQLGIKDPNLIQKTFNKYNSLPFGVKTAINTMAPVELMKLFNIGNAINTGVNQLKNPVLTDEDLTLDATQEISFEGNSPFMRNQINERVIAAENEYLKQGKMPPEFLGDKIRMNMELGNYKGYMGPGFEEGGRVGLFMGGSPLEGEALSIYNSMKAYGNDDQTIADRLQALGMYTPGGTTPDTPSDNIIGSQINQGGGDKPMIQPFRQDPRVGAAFEAYQRNQGLKAMGIEDPFADEISLQGAYYGDMPNVDLKPGSQSMMGKIKSGIGEVMNFPLVKGMSMMTPFGFAKQGLNALKGLMPVNQRAIQENIMGNMGVAVDDIGRVVNTGDYSDPSNIMAGYSANSSPETFDKRIDRTSKTLSEKYGLSDQQIEGILSGTLTDEEMANVNNLAISDAMSKAYGKKTTTNLVKQLRSLAIAKDQSAFAQDLAKKEAERQRQIKEQEKLARQLRRAEKEIAAKGYQDYGQGGADQATQDSYAGSDGSYAGASTQDYGGGEKDGGIIGYRKGGLATMFTRKR
jgi:hypothetical protein